jgi:hypothetical protein
MLNGQHTVTPRVSNVDTNAAYPLAFQARQASGELESERELRPAKYWNKAQTQRS